MPSFRRLTLAATFAGMVSSIPVTAETRGEPVKLAQAQTQQGGTAAGSVPQSKTDPRKPGEPSAAAQPPQEGHSPLPVKPADRNVSETGQPAQSIPPGHNAKR